MLFKVKPGQTFGSKVPPLSAGAIVELDAQSARGFSDLLEPYTPLNNEEIVVSDSALGEPDDLTALTGVGASLAKRLSAAGYPTFAQVAQANRNELAAIKGLSLELADTIIADAQSKIGEGN